MEKKSTVQKEIKMFILLTIASVVMAFNLKSFVNTGGLFPGGFSGLTLLIQQIGSEFFHISIPYSIIYVPLNLVPAFIGLKYIGKKFTFYSFYVVFFPKPPLHWQSGVQSVRTLSKRWVSIVQFHSCLLYTSMIFFR